MDLETKVRTMLETTGERFEQPEPNRLDVYIKTWRLPEAVQALLVCGCQLAAITGMDLPQTNTFEGGTELLYHFTCGANVMTLRFSVTYGDPVAPSICSLIPSATLYEREVMEMYGVILEGTPVRDRLLLPDDWPEGVYPMRKSFHGLES